MKRVATTFAVLAATMALLSGCGGDSDSDSDPAGGGPAGGVTDEGCTAEIRRQLSDPSTATKDVPPQCKGISDDRLKELFSSAVSSGLGTASPAPSPN